METNPIYHINDNYIDLSKIICIMPIFYTEKKALFNLVTAQGSWIGIHLDDGKTTNFNQSKKDKFEKQRSDLITSWKQVASWRKEGSPK